MCATVGPRSHRRRWVGVSDQEGLNGARSQEFGSEAQKPEPVAEAEVVPEPEQAEPPPERPKEDAALRDG